MTPAPYIVFDIETTGLNPWYGDRVTCVCAKDSAGNAFRGVNRTGPGGEGGEGQAAAEGEGENRLIRQFMDWVADRPDYQLVSVNGRGFDVPFILARGYLTGLTTLNAAAAASFKPGILLDREHFDLMTLAVKWISLNDLAALFLGPDHKKSGSGFQAIRLYEQRAYTELLRYCLDDVDLTEQVYLKYLEIHAPPAERTQVAEGAPVGEGADKVGEGVAA